jgi:monoamine oxidase
LPPSLPYSSSKKHLPFRLIAQCIETTKKTGVIVTGAGLAGLVAATRLNSQNIPFLLLEASDVVGCRVWTDVVDGSCLDRGFQIFIIAYREAQKLLDYKKPLDLQKSSR